MMKMKWHTSLGGVPLLFCVRYVTMNKYVGAILYHSNFTKLRRKPFYNNDYNVSSFRKNNYLSINSEGVIPVCL